MMIAEHQTHRALSLLRPSRRAVIAGLSALALPVPAFAQTIKRGGTLVVAINDNPPDLVTGVGTNILTITVGGQIFDTLIRIDRDMKVLPSLAKSWELSPDGLAITFHLQEGVMWHDGQPFTSDDVKFSLLDMNGKYNSLANAAYKTIEAIDTPDPLTVVIRSKAPDPAFFPWSFSQPNFAQIFPKHIYAGSDPRNNPANFKPIGTGPFRFKDWVRGSAITLIRNPTYFDKDHVYLDQIVFQVIPEANAREIALEKGDVDHLPYFALATSSIDSLASDSNTEVIPAMRPALGEIIMFFNLRNAPLNNKDVRHAIATAIDRENLVKLALDGRGKAATGPIRSDDPPFYNGNVPLYQRDVAKANALLEKAGFPRKSDGSRMSLRLTYEAAGEGGAQDLAGQVIREQLKDIGITLQLQPTDAASWQDASFMKWDFDMTLGSFGTGPDPKIGVSRLYLTENIKRGNATNLMGYSNPAVDDLLHKADVEMNPQTRAKLYQDAQALMVEDLPALWLWEKTYPIAVRKGLVGLPSGSMHSEGFVGVGWTT